MDDNRLSYRSRLFQPSNTGSTDRTGAARTGRRNEGIPGSPQRNTGNKEKGTAGMAVQPPGRILQNQKFQVT